MKRGGILEIYREVIPLQSKPLNMPKKIVVDVSEMDINDTVNVADLKLPEGVAAVFDQNFAVVSVLAKAKDDAAADEAEAEA